MGLFAGAGKAQVSVGGVYFLPGSYEVEIQKVTTIRSRKNNKDFFVVEAKILESDNPERRPGTVASQVIDIGNIMGLPNIKAFLAAANGIDPKDTARVEEALGCEYDTRGNIVRDYGEEAAEFAVSEANPLAGIRLGLVCTEIRTQKGNPFTKHDWSPREQVGDNNVPF